MNRPIRIGQGCVVLLALCFAGCATKPQILPLDPKIDIRGSQTRGSGRSLALDIIDARVGKLLGYRDPGDPGTAITSAPEMLRNVEREVRAGYERLGFDVVEAGEDADIVIEVRLVELGYVRESGGVLRNVNTGATVEVTSVMPTKTVKAVYSDEGGKDSLLKPSLEANATMMNRRLSAALSDMLADERLTTD